MRQAARLWLVVVPAALIAGGIAFALGVKSDHGGTPPTAVLVVLCIVGWSFIAAGLIARTRRPANRTGILLIAVGFTWLLNGLSYANGSFVWTIGYAIGAIWIAVFVHALLAYPSGLIASKREQALVVFGYALAATANVAAGLFDPAPATGCDDCPTNALLVSDNETAADLILLIVQVLGAVFLVWVAVAVIQHWRRSTPAGRRLLGPVLLVGGISIAGLGLSLALQPVSDIASEVVNALAALGFVAVPFLFLWGILRSRLARGDVGKLLFDRRGPGTPEEAQENLREALGDPTVELVYWLADREHYVDVTGQATELPLDSPSRVVTPIAYDDRPVGALIHDPALRQEQELVDVVVGALRVGIERDRLQAELLARLDELQGERNFVRDVVNAAPSYFVVTDEEGLLIRFNDTLFAATGVMDDDDARGRPWWELFALPGEADGLRDWFLAARQDMKRPRMSPA